VSYSNIRARLGAGANNLADGGEYPLIRHTNNYQLLVSLYRGSWICRKVVDVLAEDMLKHLPRIKSQVSPEALDKFNRVVRVTATQAKLLEALKWGRLFGGAVAVICIDGVKDLSEPLDPAEVLPGKYRGLIVLDRWNGVYADSELITDLSNPGEFGLPKFYRCDMSVDGRGALIHHSRILRFVGRDLPLIEKQAQTYWGMSELELVFDELRKRDYSSWSIASLISRANIMAVKDPELAQALSGLGLNAKALEMFLARLQAISDSMNNQGLLALGKDGSLEQSSYSFGGLADIYNTFMLDVAGACEIPVSRLYGRTITGLGQSGEGDLQVYYDTADQKRQREVGPQLEKLYRVIAASVWGEIPDDMDYEWLPIRTMSDKDRAELAEKTTKPIFDAFTASLIGRKTALMELRQQSELTGMFSNITDEMIAAADDEVGPGDLDLGEPGSADLGKVEQGAAGDSAAIATRDFAGIPVAIEHLKGSRRTIRREDGTVAYERVLQFDYGYIPDTTGRDGDEIDVILGPDLEARRVFIVDMTDLGPDVDKREDEDKVLLGFPTAAAARAAFLTMYPPEFIGGMESMSLVDFRRNWLGEEMANAA
jgi:phage-related protein (TIGR01555 family)